MTGADCPGNSTAQSGALASTFSGRPVSREEPFWSGPRHESHPMVGPAGATAGAAGLAGAAGAAFLGAAWAARVNERASASKGEVFIREARRGERGCRERWPE